MSSNSYGQNLLKHSLPASSPDTLSPWHPSQLRRHPYISPSLESSEDSLSLCLHTARAGAPKILITWGTAELFADACKQMVATLRKAGWKEEDVKVIAAQDLTHVWAAYPEWLAPQVSDMWRTIRDFLGVEDIDKTQ